MKTIALLIFIFVVAHFISLGSASAAATTRQTAGGQDAGGGNVFEIEFKTVGQLLLKQIKQSRLTDSQIGFSFVQFQIAINEVQIFETEKVMLNDQSRHAINSVNARVIVFNGQIWGILNLDQKRMLVLHEYLRFVGVDDSQYTFTIRTLDLLAVPSVAQKNQGRTLKIINSNQDRQFLYSLTFEKNITAKIECIGSTSGGPSTSKIVINFPASNNSLSTKRVIRNYHSGDPACRFLNLLALATPEDPVFFVLKDDGSFVFHQ